jgi:PilZ domain
MDYLDRLRTEVEDLERLDRWRSGGNGEAVRVGNTTDCEEAWFRDFQQIALLVCVCATLSNALEAEVLSAPIVFELLPCFLPQSELNWTKLADAEAASLAAEANTRLTFARRVANAWLSVAHHSESNARVDASTMADAWFHASSACFQAGRRRSGRSREAAPSHSTMTSTLVMLADAIAGGHPCLDESGQLSIPGWAERRSAIRRKCFLPVHVWTGQIESSAEIINLSTTGAGLRSSVKISVGAQLTICIERRTLQCSVKWASPNRFGVAWQIPLQRTDPLLQIP